MHGLCLEALPVFVFESTRTWAPSISCSMSRTVSITASSEKFTKPKPLLRPEDESIMMWLFASPNWLKYASNDSLVVCWASPPIQIFRLSRKSKVGATIGATVGEAVGTGAAGAVVWARMPVGRPLPTLALVGTPLCFGLLPWRSQRTSAPSISCCTERTRSRTESSVKFTKPKPRLRPVPLSIMTILDAGPNFEKYAFRDSFVVLWDSPPIQIFNLSPPL
mmetsp:Transcript_123458/g.348872  ORF Transcript_123458/g.348872 Transcript_123458/m.348872 type:complete len:221 (+) Transcript_123458:720-1382(+)